MTTKPGPKPKPKALRIFEGNPGHIPLNDREPEPEDCQDLVPPEWLSDDCPYMDPAKKFNANEVAKIIWDRVAPVLERLGVLKDIDKDKLARYCYLFAQWLKCKAFIDQHGTEYPIYSEFWAPKEDPETGKTKNVWTKALKKLQPYPHISRLVSLSAELGRYEGEFGIGAASRTRIQTIIKDVLEGNESGVDKDFDYATRELRAVK